jgi:exopolyphosphatase/guanosine-5'-triphosphate,3'-diphosphate pyrophosphatase
VDLGSNTSTLAVYGVGPDGFVDRIFQRGESLKLIRQLGPDGMLSSAAMDKTIQLVHGFLKIAREQGAFRVKVVATAAIRDARNGPDLLGRLAADGADIRLLSAESEGIASVVAAVNTLPLEKGFCFDLGGGSIQIIRFSSRSVERVVSLPLGALRLSDTFLSADPPTGPQLTAMRRHIDAQLQKIDWFHPQAGLPLIGIGGTARALGKIDRRTRQWPVVHGHGYALDRDGVEAIFEETSRMPSEMRQKIPGLSDHRVDIVVGGALLINRVMLRAGVSSLTLCHYGIREGIALQEVFGEVEPKVEDVREAGLHGRFPDDPSSRARGERAGMRASALLKRAGGGGELGFLVVVAARLGAAHGGLPDDEHAATLLSTPLPGFLQHEILALVDLLGSGVGPPRRLAWDERDLLRGILKRALVEG